MYCLHYCRRNVRKTRTNNQKFCAYTSVDMGSPLNLKNPLLIFEDVNLCRRRNNIYFYNQTLAQHTVEKDSSNFSDKEIRRGIYVYMSELDDWFPVPLMNYQVKNACMVIHDDRLYLVGGTLNDTVYLTTSALRSSSSSIFSISKKVQAYDYREGAWKALFGTSNNFVGADCCAFGGHIYV